MRTAKVAPSSEITDGTATSRRNLRKGKRIRHAAVAAAATDASEGEATPTPVTAATTRLTTVCKPPPAPPSSAETKKATDVLLQALAEKPIGG